MNKVLLNIVMPVYNRLQLTQKSLLHLKKAKLANSAVPFVITVVDNGSDEPLREKLIFLKEEGIIDNLFLLQKNMGIACACNIGWLAVESDFFLKMDNDVVIQNPNFIQNLLKMYGLVEPFSTLGPAANRDMIPSSPKIKETPYGLLALCPKTLPGNALLIPKIVSDVLGYFNEDYGLYGAEDGDYGVRLNFAGFKQYYYRHQEYFTLEGKNDDYDGYELNKVEEHRRLFYEDKKVGLFKLNHLLYNLCIRNAKVPLRYEIAEKNGYYTVIRERKDYQVIHEALERSRNLVDHAMKRNPILSEKTILLLKRIWKDCGEECDIKKLIPENSLS